MSSNPGGAVKDALAAQHDALGALLDGLTEDEWSRPSWCDGWSVSDVVLHLAQTDEMALASLEDRFADALDRFIADVPPGAPAANVDEGAGALVAHERGAPPAEVHERWRAGSTALQAAVAAADPHARTQWVVGEMSVQTLTSTRLAEAWIHTTDILHAFDRTPEPADQLWHIARLAWRTLPYAFARAGEPAPGPVTFELDAPAGGVWTFAPEGDAGADPAPTVLRGTALDLCLVAGQRADPSATTLTATGPDADAVLALVRTFA